MSTGHSRSSRLISGALSTTAEHTMPTGVCITTWLSSLAKRSQRGICALTFLVKYVSCVELSEWVIHTFHRCVSYQSWSAMYFLVVMLRLWNSLPVYIWSVPSLVSCTIFIQGGHVLPSCFFSHLVITLLKTTDHIVVII